MHKNKDYIDFPIYKMTENSEGELIKTNKFSYAYLTILIPESDNSNNNIEFLKKIISALDISWESDCRIRVFKNDKRINLAKIFYNDNSNYLIAFGFATDQFDTQAILKINKWNNFNSFNLLLSYSLAELIDNNTNKRILWNELKSKFNGK